MLAGITAVALGVLEFEAFYLFGPGGKFEYEGFAFGSFMFANIACQVAAYYAIGLLLIPRLWPLGAASLGAAGDPGPNRLLDGPGPAADRRCLLHAGHRQAPYPWQAFSWPAPC